MLGAFLAILSAASFAATKAAATRGVVTGTPAQGMVLTNPVGVVTLVLAVVLLGEPCTMLQMMGGAPSSRSACVRRLRRLLGPRVIMGSAISLAGASAVAVDTEIILNALALTDEVARALAWQF
jgi:hypothetical protein